MYRKWCRAPGQGGWVEKCPEVGEKVLGQRGEQKGPEPPLCSSSLALRPPPIFIKGQRVSNSDTPSLVVPIFFKLPGTSSMI
jgi:hypothetical protein